MSACLPRVPRLTAVDHQYPLGLGFLFDLFTGSWAFKGLLFFPISSLLLGYKTYN
jgi:hypothetical protein